MLNILSCTKELLTDYYLKLICISLLTMFIKNMLLVIFVIICYESYTALAVYSKKISGSPVSINIVNKLHHKIYKEKYALGKYKIRRVLFNILIIDSSVQKIANAILKFAKHHTLGFFQCHKKFVSKRVNVDYKSKF